MTAGRDVLVLFSADASDTLRLFAGASPTSKRLSVRLSSSSSSSSPRLTMDVARTRLRVGSLLEADGCMAGSSLGAGEGRMLFSVVLEARDIWEATTLGRAGEAGFEAF